MSIKKNINSYTPKTKLNKHSYMNIDNTKYNK